MHKSYITIDSIYCKTRKAIMSRIPNSNITNPDRMISAPGWTKHRQESPVDNVNHAKNEALKKLNKSFENYLSSYPNIKIISKEFKSTESSRFGIGDKNARKRICQRLNNEITSLREKYDKQLAKLGLKPNHVAFRDDFYRAYPKTPVLVFKFPFLLVCAV